MILNPEKCHYICLRKDSVSDFLGFCAEVLEAGELETVLGIATDNKLNFENHIKSLCSKASQKLGALKRISNLLNPHKKNLLFNSIIKSVQLLPTCLDILLKKTKFSSTIHQQNVNVLMKYIYLN